MRITYSPHEDMIQFELKEPKSDESFKTVRAQDKRCKVDLYVSITPSNEILSIVIFDATKVVPAEVLNAAEHLLPPTDEELALFMQGYGA